MFAFLFSVISNFWGNYRGPRIIKGLCSIFPHGCSGGTCSLQCSGSRPLSVLGGPASFLSPLLWEAARCHSPFFECHFLPRTLPRKWHWVFWSPAGSLASNPRSRPPWRPLVSTAGLPLCTCPLPQPVTFHLPGWGVDDLTYHAPTSIFKHQIYSICLKAYRLLKLKRQGKNIFLLHFHHIFSPRHPASLGLAAWMGQEDHGWVWILGCWGPGILFVLLCARHLSVYLVPSLIMKTKQSETSPALGCSPCLERSLASVLSAGGLTTPKLLCQGWWVTDNGTGHGCDQAVGATGSQLTCKSTPGPSGSQSRGQRFRFLGHLTIPWDDGRLPTRKSYLACDYC